MPAPFVRSFLDSDVRSEDHDDVTNVDVASRDHEPD
jgi:hypothetical protein